VVVENSLVPYHRLQLGIREEGRPRLDSLSAYPWLTHPTTGSGQGTLRLDVSGKTLLGLWIKIFHDSGFNRFWHMDDS
jgi:hypothetical protein